MTTGSGKPQSTGFKNKLKRLFLPIEMWTRIDKILVAMTRDLTTQVGCYPSFCLSVQPFLPCWRVSENTPLEGGRGHSNILEQALGRSCRVVLSAAD